MRRIVDHYRGRGGFLDLGEQVVLEIVANDVRGKPLLDLGVGRGRTVPLLHLLYEDYLGMAHPTDRPRPARAGIVDAADKSWALPRTFANYRRVAAFRVDDGRHALAPNPAHDYSLLL
jgi:hypothetical protein